MKNISGFLCLFLGVCSVFGSAFGKDHTIKAPAVDAPSIAPPSVGKTELKDLTIDKDHTSILFTVPHLVVSKVQGRFDLFEGSLQFDSKGVLKGIQGKAIVASINTNNEKRDKHLKSPDFFELDKFPELLFQVENLDIKQKSSKKVAAQLTIKGIQKTVMVDVSNRGVIKDPWGTQKLVVDAKATVNRKDFGLLWNEVLETGGVMVGEKVSIEVQTQVSMP
jgi:polyisoprenoid-binding protein YceI